MGDENLTEVTDIFLLGFQGLNGFRFLLFTLLLLAHILTLTGNLLIIVLVSTTRQLQSSMYFFLCHLSFTDLMLSLDIVPNMLYVTWREGGAISFHSCLTQFQFFGETICTECLLLTVMSYDRYLAICKPLHYSSIMNARLQFKLVIWAWLLGFLMTNCIVVQMCNLQFCGNNVIDHYFCDFEPVLGISCSNVSIVRIQGIMFSGILSVPPFSVIVVTYFFIFHAIIKISTTKGREKAFYTCSSHLAVVCAYFISLIAIYLSSSQRHSFNADKLLSLLNTIGTPLFNPIIYSLRNVDIKGAIQSLVFKRRPK